DSANPNLKSCHNLVAPASLLAVFLPRTARKQPARMPALQNCYEGLFVERRNGVVQDVESPVFVGTFFPALAIVELAFLRRTRKLARPLDGTHDMLGDRRRELQEFAARTFQREAM